MLQLSFPFMEDPLQKVSSLWMPSSKASRQILLPPPAGMILVVERIAPHPETGEMLDAETFGGIGWLVPGPNLPDLKVSRPH